MQQSTEATAVAQTAITYLSKTTPKRAIILVKEAQSYYQEEVAVRLFATQKEKAFLKFAKKVYFKNNVFNAFCNAITHLEEKTLVEISTDYLQSNEVCKIIAKSLFCYLIHLKQERKFYDCKDVKISLQTYYLEVENLYLDLNIYINSKTYSYAE